MSVRVGRWHVPPLRNEWILEPTAPDSDLLRQVRHLASLVSPMPGGNVAVARSPPTPWSCARAGYLPSAPGLDESPALGRETSRPDPPDGSNRGPRPTGARATERSLSAGDP